MDMKIYNRSLTGAQAEAGRTQETQKTESSASNGTNSPGRTAGSDQVELSGALGRLSQALSTQGSARTEKVASLASTYGAGGYQPNAQGASKGLVAEAMSAGGGH